MNFCGKLLNCCSIPATSRLRVSYRWEIPDLAEQDKTLERAQIFELFVQNVICTWLWGYFIKAHDLFQTKGAPPTPLPPQSGVCWQKSAATAIKS